MIIIFIYILLLDGFKSILNPSNIKIVGSHSGYSQIRKHVKNVRVNDSLAITHHYRKGFSVGFLKLKNRQKNVIETVENRRILYFQKRVKPHVEKTKKYLNL